MVVLQVQLRGLLSESGGGPASLYIVRRRRAVPHGMDGQLGKPAQQNALGRRERQRERQRANET